MKKLTRRLAKSDVTLSNVKALDGVFYKEYLAEKLISHLTLTGKLVYMLASLRSRQPQQI